MKKEVKTRKIFLSGEKNKGMFVLVDEEDFENLNKYKWYYSSGYAIYRARNKHHFMHRIILKTPEGKYTDHINRDKMDNRKDNLRVATRSQNVINTATRPNNTSGYKGVCKGKPGKWRARLNVDGKRVSLGNYKTKEEAARVYEEASKRYYGEFAR